MSHKEKRKCAKCNITATDDPTLSFHRFPLPRKHGCLRARVWAEYCYPDEDWTSDKSLELLHKQHKVLCSQHFDESAYTSGDKKRLNIFSVPIGTNNILLKVNEQQESQSSRGDETTNLQKIVVEAIAAPSINTSDQLCIPVQHNLTAQTKTKGLLKPLDVHKVSELTSKKQKLYKSCRRNLSEIFRLRKKLKNNKVPSVLPALMQNENVRNLLNNKISKSFALMLRSQLLNTPRKLTGRRWNIDDKVMALSIFKRSPACYRLLKKMFCLPSESTLKSLLNEIPMVSGINPQIFSTIRDITEKRNNEENLCILAFDEMSIRKNLTYNSRYDILDGYQEHGNQGRSMAPATHALLFMAIGLRKCWKQPLAFYFSGDNVTADRLSVLIKEVLEASFQSGLNICATVCNNFGVNVKALNSLGSSVNRPYFDFKGNEVVTIMDPPHLIKCFRNNFLKYNIECNQEIKINEKPIKGIAKWSHVKEFYEKDNVNPNFVFAPALTKQHIEPNFKQKMKVSLASQVFSHSVAAGMFAKIATSDLLQEATATAEVIEKIDKLFDSLNGDTPDIKRGKKYLTNLTEKSPHLSFFNEMKLFFSTIKFIGARSKPPSQEGFIRTLNAVERLFKNLREMFTIRSLATRRLNQDPLENCFGVICNNCGSNPNPNTIQFVAALKTAIISNLIHTSKNKNCQDDNNVILDDLKTFLCIDNRESSSSSITPAPEFDVTIGVQSQDTVIPECSGEMQACAYVCGFIVKKLSTNCDNCKTSMLVDQNTELNHIFTSYKEYDSIKSSLKYVHTQFVYTVELGATKVNEFLKHEGHKTHIKAHLIDILLSELNFDWLVCSEHFESNRRHIIVSTICICIKRFCLVKNREFADEASKKAVKRKINILKNL